MAVSNHDEMNESELSKRLNFIRGVEKILSQAVKEYSRLTGIAAEEIRNHLSIRRIDASLIWIEFEYGDSHFYYRRHE
ncbi:MAG: hypothetical protein JW736_03105 [Deltaproteobacteria bacterium]|nr:hypothetical protein [Deltaproteobacteria bacterium]MBN2688635.1 hypothetical protein [Deltaproteobacteria bacterium]